ncbi:uncharacterized protein EAF02_007661 [Botrytis sinoallii]|uniref:uncharacterized protein n=1 Tax=Botrytis sinoallii TaxID=1463999 RepID=UPI0018FF4C25|nr:uncharacterized protein EAF02_007661 [Botrytis sinoallii]KAF7880024.1 hypothetical protein EAF02_007661 [Botrytis sinoallii]
MKVDISDYNCPKKNTLNSKGYCSKPIPNVPGKEGCSAYCEIRVTLKYGQEMPMSGGVMWKYHIETGTDIEKSR